MASGALDEPQGRTKQRDLAAHAQTQPARGPTKIDSTHGRARVSACLLTTEDDALLLLLPAFGTLVVTWSVPN